MKWSCLFAVLICSGSGITSAAVIDINDPDTLVIDSAMNWEIFSNTIYNYNNILIAENGVLNISGTSLIPDMTLNSAGNVEIYGALNIQDVRVTLSAVDLFYLSGNIISNTGLVIQRTIVDPGSTSSSIVISSTDPGVLNAPDITFASLTGDVPLPASMWLMLSGLAAVLWPSVARGNS